MPGDLRKETPACAYNGNGDNREFLDRGVRELADRRYGIIAERLFIKRRQILHCIDLMPALGKPGRKHHVFLGLRHRLAVQNLYFNSVDWSVPPLQSLSVKTDS